MSGMYRMNWSGTGGGGGMPTGIRNLLIATIGVYVLQMVPGVRNYVHGLGLLVPRLVYEHAQVWRLVTYMFLHDPSGVLHIGFNMLMLWMFGNELEQMWGTRRFLIFYFLCGIGAGALSFFMWNAHILGASGAIYGVLTIFAIYFPDRQILVFFMFPMRIRTFVIVMGIVSVVMSIQAASGIAHLTHLGGIVVALVYYRFYDRGEEFIRAFKEAREEKKSRRRVEELEQRKRYYDDVVDPILKKISEQGMESLTPGEKKALEKARQNGTLDGEDKIRPFRRK